MEILIYFLAFRMSLRPSQPLLPQPMDQRTSVLASIYIAYISVHPIGSDRPPWAAGESLILINYLAVYNRFKFYVIK